jgi:hypothetical protein
MRRLLITFLSLLGAASAQSWSAVPFGSGCGDLAFPWYPNTPICGYSGQASPGATLTLQYGGSTAYNAGTGPFFEYRPMLVLGLSDGAWGNVPLPWLLPSAWNPWVTCQLLVAPDLIVPMQAINAWSYASSYALPIPNDPQLIGFRLFAQWAVVYTQFGIFPAWSRISMSNALAITVGT